MKDSEAHAKGAEVHAIKVKEAEAHAEGAEIHFQNLVWIEACTLEATTEGS